MRGSTIIMNDKGIVKHCHKKKNQHKNDVKKITQGRNKGFVLLREYLIKNGFPNLYLNYFINLKL